MYSHLFVDCETGARQDFRALWFEIVLGSMAASLSYGIVPQPIPSIASTGGGSCHFFGDTTSRESLHTNTQAGQLQEDLTSFAYWQIFARIKSCLLLDRRNIAFDTRPLFDALAPFLSHFQHARRCLGTREFQILWRGPKDWTFFQFHLCHWSQWSWKK